MSVPWIAFLIALVTALALTPAARRLALAAGVVDRPNERSVHRQPVPLLGGLAVFAAVSAAVGGPALAGRLEGPVAGILLGGLAMVLVGLLDDLVALRPAVKLAGQVLAAAVLPACGVRIDYLSNPFGDGMLTLGALAVPLTILWTVALVNVMNLADGLDGLAAGIAAIASLTLLLAGAMQPYTPALALVLAAALAGAGVGFLPYNFHPARVFLGDAGSLGLGYLLAATSIVGYLKSPAAMTLAVPVLALGLPILDTGLAIYRRWRRGTPIARADREHLHHRLLQLGLSQREVALAMYAVSGWLGVSALAVVRVSVGIAVGIVAFVVLTMGLAAWKVGMLSPRPLRPQQPVTRHQ